MSLEKVKTEFQCFDCERHIKVVLDMTLEMTHIVVCKYCSYKHYVTKEGEITDDPGALVYNRKEIQRPNTRYYTTSYSTSSTTTNVPFIYYTVRSTDYATRNSNS